MHGQQSVLCWNPYRFAYRVMAIRQSNARHTRMFCALTNESGSMRNICPTARQPASVTATSVVSNMPTGDNIMDTDRKLRAGYGRCMPGEQQSCITLRKNEVQVSATGEVSLAPDRCRITIAISSRKEEAQDAVTSVDRRREYIMQTLHNYKISVNVFLFAIHYLFGLTEYYQPHQIVTIILILYLNY